tara:strand:+ start:92 stop:340 length:249 start_codon:yes stop_codon:yes gene_type:complete
MALVCTQSWDIENIARLLFRTLYPMVSTRRSLPINWTKTWIPMMYPYGESTIENIGGPLWKTPTFSGTVFQFSMENNGSIIR